MSMEADPATFDAQRLKQYMALGLTRFSIGVQAFQEVSLCQDFLSDSQAYLQAVALSTLLCMSAGLCP
jgi:coproporphyrinogen III oxidase-like Fe-S oxidoreductase